MPKPPQGLDAWVGRPIWREVRRPRELRQLKKDPIWDGEGVPLGRGKPVLIIPGFFSGRSTADPLAHVLSSAGWDVHVADVGRNMGPAYEAIEAAEAGLEALSVSAERKAIIIGHSRGGQFGRVVAVRRPDVISKVVAVGTPLTIKYPSFFLVKLPAEALDKAWRAGAFGYVDEVREKEIDDLRYVEFPQHVDLVSVYSTTDGIVDWRLSVEPAATCIEVDTSHTGLFNSVAGIRAITAALTKSG
jgi:triacylglycerol lipase